MDISIVIVNYNVKHFLEQCLHSVYKALGGLKGEVFVVDNKSVDGSCQMVKEKFPKVRLIENNNNIGFSKANNQAIRMAKGRYVLLLNPDTFVQEDTLVKCVEFCDKNSDAGGLGVKMIDGKGAFLPESKRSLPTPAVAFYKIFGLSALFPKSKIFGKYNLGYIDKEYNHKVEILAGAFMFLRKSVLDEIGLLDETFFMYGEDIDLSYRIVQAGYSNYYFSETTIIHYKGESTKKGSINYVMVFYKAMIIFARKHFSKKNARIYSLFINLAIYLRAALGITRRIVLSVFEPVLDFALIYIGYYFLTPFWELYKSGLKDYYPPKFYLYIIPSYILIWMFFVFLAGGYEKRIKPSGLLRGVLVGTISIIVVYSLLPESLRFSRALILLGSIWALFSFFLARILGAVLFSIV
jgi:GT2 family glycosyltransferase